MSAYAPEPDQAFQKQRANPVSSGVHLLFNIYNDVIIFKTQVCDVATILELVVVLAKEDALKG